MKVIDFKTLALYVDNKLTIDERREIERIIAENPIYEDGIRGIIAMIENKPEDIETIDYIRQTSREIAEPIIRKLEIDVIEEIINDRSIQRQLDNSILEV